MRAQECVVSGLRAAGQQMKCIKDKQVKVNKSAEMSGMLGRLELSRALNINSAGS